jgi:hypothetical protein
MPKYDDFGGLPETVFQATIADLTNTSVLGALTAQQRLDLLGAIAIEEHAAANSTKAVNVADVTIISLRINEFLDQLRSATSTATTVPNLLTEIKNLTNLW